MAFSKATQELRARLAATAVRCPVLYVCTFRHPGTKELVAEEVQARNANEAMDAVWRKYEFVGFGVGSIMARPRGVRQFG